MASARASQPYLLRPRLMSHSCFRSGPSCADKTAPLTPLLLHPHSTQIAIYASVFMLMPMSAVSENLRMLSPWWPLSNIADLST